MLVLGGVPQPDDKLLITRDGVTSVATFVAEARAAYAKALTCLRAAGMLASP